ncbi:MAG TPA: inositol monophosphatase family protein [Casimicrobiaceae bacterium]|nr:inositol monophosphatase family protein [Casimicrobiaceae bacterium]
MTRLDFASTLARDAGRLAHTAFGASQTSNKGVHDIVTAMDGDVERFIRAAIAKRYPDDSVLGEEEGGQAGKRAWIVDPIDGTANFARGIPHYCVSIAYLENGEPMVGVLYDPSHDWLYAAARGEGARCNDVRMKASSCADIRAATVECGWSTRRSTDDYLALLARVMHAGCAIRRAGSGALGLADVAAGRVEGYCELHINSWDCAAGIVLVREAGGATSDFFAGEGIARGNPLLACNAPLCATLAAVSGIPITR